MSISFQTNYASLVAINNLNQNQNFQTQTIEQLTSGYRINQSGDDAAGLAVANQYASSVAQLTQGVINGNDGVSALQIIDGGLSNITTILNRLQTLATESASGTFTGNRATLNNEYQGLLAEIDRQAANINLNTGGQYNTNLVTYIGGGSNQPNSQVSVDLSGATNAVDSSALGLASTSVAGGGTELSNNTVNLSNTAVTFLASGNQTFTFHIGTSGGNQDVAVELNTNSSAAGLTGQQVIDSLNSQLANYGITSSIAADGGLEFSGGSAFTVTAGAASAGNAVATTNANAVNTSDYNLDNSTGTGGNFADFTVGGGTSASETVVFQNAGGTKTVTLDDTNASTQAQALSTLNTALNSLGIYAVKSTTNNGGNISFQSASAFSVNETAYTAGANGGTGNLFGAVGAVAVTSPVASASSTAAAESAITKIQEAVTNLGLVQGQVGAGENKLQYAINLANSQITNFDSAESQIKDADVATEAANLTKAQVLQQASVAALAQANSAPQALLKLLQ